MGKLIQFGGVTLGNTGGGNIPAFGFSQSISEAIQAVDYPRAKKRAHYPRGNAVTTIGFTSTHLLSSWTALAFAQSHYRELPKQGTLTIQELVGYIVVSTTTFTDAVLSGFTHNSVGSTLTITYQFTAGYPET